MAQEKKKTRWNDACGLSTWGFACYHAWFLLMLVNPGVFLEFGEDYRAISDSIYFGSMLVETVLILVVAVVPHWVGRVFDSRFGRVVVCVVVAAAAPCALFYCLAPALLFVLCIVCSGAGVLLIAAWGCRYAAIDASTAALGLASAYFVSSMFAALFAVLAPVVVQAAVSCALPVGSLVIFFKTARGHGGSLEAQRGSFFLILYRETKVSRSLLKLLLVPMLLGTAVSFFLLGDTGTAEDVFILRGDWARLVVANALMLAIVYVSVRYARNVLCMLWRILVFLLVGTMLVRAVFPVSALTAVLTKLSVDFYSFTMLLFMVGAAQRYPGKQLAIFAGARLMYYIGFLMGFALPALYDVLVTNFGVQGPSLLLALVIMACYMFVLTENRLQVFMTDLNHASREGLIAQATQALIRKYGLSQRESEIVELKAFGHTNKKIGDILGLALGTVNSYQSRIYQKMGVSSRQEFVDKLLSHMEE